jgi:hypothetical protein
MSSEREDTSSGVVLAHPTSSDRFGQARRPRCQTLEPSFFSTLSVDVDRAPKRDVTFVYASVT